MADITSQVQSAIATATGELPVAGTVTSYSNDDGVAVPGYIVEQGTGVMNPAGDIGARVFGEEYLCAFHGLFMGDNGSSPAGFVAQKTIVLSGDSTTFGVGSDPNHDPATLLAWSARTAGYAGVNVVNHGQPGKSTQD